MFFVSFDEHLRKFCRGVILPEDEVIPCNECTVLGPVKLHVTTDWENEYGPMYFKFRNDNICSITRHRL